MGGIAVVLLVVSYALVQPILVEEFGIRLPTLRSDSSGETGAADVAAKTFHSSSENRSGNSQNSREWGATITSSADRS